MAVNPYFDSVKNASTQDQQLADDLTIEAIQIHGNDVYYVPRTLENFDKLFGEDAISAFNSAITIEMIMTNMTQWNGQNSFLSKFGLVDYDEATMQVSITRFNDVVTAAYPDIKRPREGDIIFLPSAYDDQARAYEISKVEKESPFYALGRLYTYTLYIRVFEYNGEKFNTGNQMIDEYDEVHLLTTEIQMEAGAGSYQAGEEVSQMSGFSAQVVAFVNDKLILNNVSGELRDDEVLIGDDSMTARMIFKVETETGNDQMTNDSTTIDDKIDAGLISIGERNPLTD